MSNLLPLVLEIMVFNSSSPPAAGENKIVTGDALTLPTRPWQADSAARENSLNILAQSPHILLQAFDPSGFAFPIYNEEWKVVEKAIMFLDDGSLLECGDFEVRSVEVHWPTLATRCRRFDEFPPEIRFRIWNFALPRPRIVSLTIDDEPEDQNQKYHCMKWTRPYVEPILYVRRQCRLGSDWNPYFH